MILFLGLLALTAENMSNIRYLTTFNDKSSSIVHSSYDSYSAFVYILTGM